VQGRASCGGGKALFDYDPAAKHVRQCCSGPPLNGGGVIAALPLPRAGLAGPDGDHAFKLAFVTGWQPDVLPGYWQLTIPPG